MSFDKTWYQLTISVGSHQQQMMLIMEIGLCNEKHFIFKNLHEFKGFGANKFATNDRKEDHFEWFLNIWENNCSIECRLVWRTADSCWWGYWWMKTTSLSLYPCKGTPFWTIVALMDTACPLLTFHIEWLNISRFVVTSCYSNAGVRFFW